MNKYIRLNSALLNEVSELFLCCGGSAVGSFGCILLSQPCLPHYFAESPQMSETAPPWLVTVNVSQTVWSNAELHPYRS